MLCCTATTTVVVSWREVPEPICERVFLVGLVTGLVIFNTVLLIKQLRGAWDQTPASPRSQRPCTPDPLPARVVEGLKAD